MGVMTAPVLGSGDCPPWIASVPRASLESLLCRVIEVSDSLPCAARESSIRLRTGIWEKFSTAPGGAGS